MKRMSDSMIDGFARELQTELDAAGNWQDAVAKAIGAIKCSPPERQRAMQYLHDSGIAYKLGGPVKTMVTDLIASGEVRDGPPDSV